MISVLIITLNEEVDLLGCLESVRWCDDVVVFDSYSTDQTLQIAEAAGARIFQRVFDTYAGQRRAALSEVMYRHPWVLMVDADERWPENIYKEIVAHLQSDGSSYSLYRFRRKDMYLGQWLRRSSGYPTWTGRLVKIGHVRVERDINEEYLSDGTVGHLNEHFLHYPFNKGFARWFERHNRYSSMEAEILFSQRQKNAGFAFSMFLDPVNRRKCLKQIAYTLPFRPLLVFIYLYIVRIGFLDGAPGLSYCILRTIYEFMIDLKVKELKIRRKNLSF